MDIAALTRRHGIEGQVSFALENGVIRMDLNNRYGSASVSLQGAQVLHWTPAGERPVIWRSPVARLTPGKAFRGGVPVCWPWFGAHEREAGFPAHGFARTARWELEHVAQTSDGGARVVLSLPQDGIPAQQWTRSCALELTVHMGPVLETELRTRNPGASPFTVAEALHAYFEVGDVRRVEVSGLDGRTYIDKVAQGALKVQEGPVVIDAEVDRVYLDTDCTCVITDPVLERRIRIVKRGSRSTVVWNPWIDKAAKLGDLGEEGHLRMLCVESANAGSNAVVVSPGSEHRLSAAYSVERLGT